METVVSFRFEVKIFGDEGLDEELGLEFGERGDGAFLLTC